MRTLIALCAACVCTVQLAASDEHACEAGSEDTSSFIQQHRDFQHLSKAVPFASFQELAQEAQHDVKASKGLPSVGDLGGMLSGALKDLGSTGIATALDALISSFGGPMDGIQASAVAFAQEVQAQKGNLTSGMAAILAKNFHLNKTDLFADAEELAQEVQRNVKVASQTWEGICTALTSVASAAGAGLSTMGKDSLKEKVDALMKSASSSCGRVSEKLLAFAVQIAEKDAQAQEKLNSIVAMAQVHDAQDPTTVCKGLNATLQDALTQAQEFIKSSDGAFDGLAEGIRSTFKTELSKDIFTKVEAALQDVTTRSKSVTANVMDTTASFLGSLSDGVGIAGFAAGVRSAAIHAGSGFAITVVVAYAVSFA